MFQNCKLQVKVFIALGRYSTGRCFSTLYTAISRKVVGKGHATIPKGIVGSFELTVLQSNLIDDTIGHGCMFASAEKKQQK